MTHKQAIAALKKRHKAEAKAIEKRTAAVVAQIRKSRGAYLAPYVEQLRALRQERREMARRHLREREALARAMRETRSDLQTKRQSWPRVAAARVAATRALFVVDSPKIREARAKLSRWTDELDQARGIRAESIAKRKARQSSSPVRAATAKREKGRLRSLHAKEAEYRQTAYLSFLDRVRVHGGNLTAAKTWGKTATTEAARRAWLKTSAARRHGGADYWGERLFEDFAEVSPAPSSRVQRKALDDAYARFLEEQAENEMDLLALER